MVRRSFSYTCGRFPDYGPPSLFFGYSWPWKRPLVGSARLETIPAINRLAAVGLEWNLCIHAATGTYSIIHSSLRAIVTASAIATPVTTISGAITVLFGSIPAGLALSGWLEAFGFIKITLFLAKGKVGAASSTSNSGCLH
jgi:hypothetical protein